MRLILPMAGNGSRFFDDGYDLPKPLIDVGGKPMFMRVIENLGNTIDFSDVTCIVRKDHVEKYAIDDRIQHYDSKINIVITDGLTEGAACTVMLATHRKSFCSLMVANTDQIQIWDRKRFDGLRQGWHWAYENYGGTIMTFQPDHDEPKHSYITVNGTTNTVTKLQEKDYMFDGIKSNIATTGVYYFHQEREFHQAAERMIAADDRVNGEFYLAPVYNYIKGDVTHYPVQKMIGMGTPEELKATLDENSDFSNWAV